MARELKGYALKRSRGLVPYAYDTSSRAYHDGAYKNWRGANAAERQHLAMMETPSRFKPLKGHCFISTPDLSWMPRDEDFTWLQNLGGTRG